MVSQAPTLSYKIDILNLAKQDSDLLSLALSIATYEAL